MGMVVEFPLENSRERRFQEKRRARETTQGGDASGTVLILPVIRIEKNLPDRSQRKPFGDCHD